MPRTGAYGYLVVEQARRPPNDGEAEPDTAKAGILHRIDPVELLEDFLQPVGGDAGPGIPHFQPDHRPPAAAGQQDPAVGR